MARPELRDQLAVVLTCEANLLSEMTHFYVDILGLEEERRWVNEADEVAWIDLRDGALRLKIARMDALPSLPAQSTTGVSLLVEVQDVEGRARAIARRAPRLDIERVDLGGVQACVVQDPLGNAVWLISYSEESPNQIGTLTPAGG